MSRCSAELSYSSGPVTMSSPTAYLHVVDARTGRVLFRKSLTDDANGKVFDYWPGAPLGGTQHVVDFSAPGWLPATRILLVDFD